MASARAAADAARLAAAAVRATAVAAMETASSGLPAQLLAALVEQSTEAAQVALLAAHMPLWMASVVLPTLLDADGDEESMVAVLSTALAQAAEQCAATAETAEAEAQLAGLEAYEAEAKAAGVGAEASEEVEVAGGVVEGEVVEVGAGPAPPSPLKLNIDGTPKVQKLNRSELLFELERRGLTYDREAPVPTLRAVLKPSVVSQKMALAAEVKATVGRGGGGDGQGGGGGDDGGGGDVGDGSARDDAPRVVCPLVLAVGGACSAADAAGFGSALDIKSFSNLAKHMSNNPRAHEGVDVQLLASAGVMPCPCCQRFFAIVGKGCPMEKHWCSPAGKDTQHVEFDESMRGGGEGRTGCPGWLTKDIDEWRQMAAPDSPATYFNYVAGAAKAKEGRQVAVARRTEAWLAMNANRRARDKQRAEQLERDKAVGLDGRRLGGETAELWGRRRRDAAAAASFTEWEWLDSLSTEWLFELDALVSRAPLLAHRSEYLRMLHHGLSYAAQEVGKATALRGFKYVILAKAVTTGRLRREASRSVKETLGRIRLVTAGHLRQLVEELFRDAGAYKAEATERATAVAAEVAAMEAADAVAGAARGYSLSGSDWPDAQ